MIVPAFQKKRIVRIETIYLARGDSQRHEGVPQRGPMDFVVYTIIFVPTGRVVYVGCTCRGEHRMNEHLDIRGGAPRVAIGFAQNRFQSRTQYFRFEIAWSGSCTIDEVHAIEQHFINKYNTRIYPRPTNGVTKDIDLMTCDEPLQLNINHACKCTEQILRAAHRIQHDSAIAVKMDTMDALLLQQCLEVVAHKLDHMSRQTAYAVIQRACSKYEAMTNDVSITEFHSDLNDVKEAYVDDDGEELKDNTMILLRAFNMDKRGTNYSLRPSTVCGHFLTLLRTLDPANSSSSVQSHMRNDIDVPDVDGRSQQSSDSIALDVHLSDSMRENYTINGLRQLSNGQRQLVIVDRESGNELDRVWTIRTVVSPEDFWDVEGKTLLRAIRTYRRTEGRNRYYPKEIEELNLPTDVLDIILNIPNSFILATNIVKHEMQERKRTVPTLSIWFQDNYVLDETLPVKHFISLNGIWRQYQETHAYTMMSKGEKRLLTQSAFGVQIQNNLMLKKYYVDRMKVRVERMNGELKQNTKAGLIHFKPKEKDDLSLDAFGDVIDDSIGIF